MEGSQRGDRACWSPGWREGWRFSVWISFPALVLSEGLTCYHFNSWCVGLVCVAIYFFGLRISLVVKFPWMSVYGICLWRVIIKQLLITNEIYKTFPGTCRIYSAQVSPYCTYMSITSDPLTKHTKKSLLGSSSGLRPTYVDQLLLEHPMFLSVHTSWHHCLRLLQPFLC